MELDELLQREGLDGEALAETVAWAQRRAEELVAGLVADSELGPLLDAAFAAQAARRREAPVSVHTADALGELPPPPDGRAAPMAAAAYDQGSVAQALPGPDESGQTLDETTQPRTVPLDGPSITTSGAIEIDAAEIEMLDEDDLELVDEDEGGAPPARTPPPEEVPEWKAALTSAAMGGGSKADQDSGLHRLPPDNTGDGLTDPSKGAPPPTPKKLAPLPIEHDESMDIDLGDM